MPRFIVLTKFDSGLVRWPDANGQDQITFATRILEEPKGRIGSVQLIEAPAAAQTAINANAAYICVPLTGGATALTTAQKTAIKTRLVAWGFPSVPINALVLTNVKSLWKVMLDYFDIDDAAAARAEIVDDTLVQP